MQRIHIVNPAAGKGYAESKIKSGSNDIIYYTKSAGDGEQYAFDISQKYDECELIVYGGDGSICDVVNGVMRAGTNDRCIISIVEAGSGNDLARCLTEEPTPIDVIKFNDRYCANMINIGFDCSVVEKTDKYKRIPLIKGSLSYTFAIADVLFRRMWHELEIEAIDANGDAVKFEKGKYLLLGIANGQFCGGGYKSASAADLSDGLLDLLVIKNIGRPRFVSLIGDYKKGTHLNPDGTVNPRFADILSYVKCKSINIKGMRAICTDGEVVECNEVAISPIHSAIRIKKYI